MKFLHLLVICLCAACSVHAALIETDSFSIEWADGYSRVPSTDPTKLQFRSHAGISVTMTVIGHRETSPEGFQKQRQAFVQYATTELEKIAKRHGKIVIPLKRDELPSGAILFTLGEHNRRSQQFGLFFVHISSQGRVAQVVIEGDGHPSERLAEFHKLITTIRWKKEPNSESSAARLP